MAWLHYMWTEAEGNSLLLCSDERVNHQYSKATGDFANIICSEVKMESLDDYIFRIPSVSDVKLMDDRLRLVGYKFKYGEMIKDFG